jgi:hypothetical protein
MNDRELAVAAFDKMARGESLSISDAQRVWGVVLENGHNIDTGKHDAFAQFYSELKGVLHQMFFSDGA